MKCENCGEEIVSQVQHQIIGRDGSILFFCFSGTERSGAAQRCPPSAMGSASAAPTEPEAVKSQPAPMAILPSNGKAEDEASDDSSVVQLPVSDSAAVSGCVWSQDRLDGSWATGCGQLWELNDGTPKENGMKFCPCCGRTLSESTYTASEQPETDDDDTSAAVSSGGS